MTTNQEFIEALYTHVLLRSADTVGLGYYLTRLDSGLITRAAVVESFAQSPELAGIPTAFAGVYQAALGRQPDISGLQFWFGVYQSGASLSQIADAMLHSAEFAASYPGAATPSLIIDQIYQNSLGRSADSMGLSNYVGLVANGMSLGSVAEAIALSDEGRARNALNMKKTLLWHAVVGDEPTATDLAGLPNTDSALAVALMDLSAEPTGFGPFWEAAQTVHGMTSVGDVVTLDLVKNVLTVGNTAQKLTTGSLAAGRNADFSGLTLDSAVNPYAVVFIGDSGANTYVGSKLGDSIDAGSGNDSITLGTGNDVVIFGNTSSVNGMDTISNFSLGVDQLDVGSFLQKTTGAVELVSVDAATATGQSWANGDVLVVQGSNLVSSSNIASLFGTNLAAPTSAGKAVVISADITGDARIWYVTNQASPTVIAPGEVVQVGLLKDVNELLDQERLSSLKASMAISSAGAQLDYSTTVFTEDPSNDGSVPTTAIIRLVGDKFIGTNGAPIGKVTGTPAGLKVSLVKISDTEAQLSFSGKATANNLADSVLNLKVKFDAKEFASAKEALNAERDDLEISFVDVNFTSGTSFVVTGRVPNPLVIDASSNMVTSGGVNIGSVGTATTFDLSAVTAPATISVRGGGGDDTIIAGSGQDTLVFEPYLSGSNLNGVDRIENFKVGTGGDKLDFTNFLGKSITTLPGAQSAFNPLGRLVNNGDVLVVQGDATIHSQASVAGLFSSTSVGTVTVYKLDPTQQAKMVVITSDLTGDAKIWYVFDETGLGTVSATTEVVEVATLVGVNNLFYNSFDLTNFA